MRDSFKLYDKNDDNQIDKHELLKVLLDLKVANPEREVEAVMSKLDSNKDGSISFGEFLKFLKTANNLKEVEVDDIVAEITHTPALVGNVPTPTPTPTPTPVAPPKPVATTVTTPFLGSPQVFVWRYEGSTVDLVGDFTNWGAHPIPARRGPEGHFYAEVRLGPGEYEYKFIIDHNIEWYYDILKPNERNAGSGYINNVITV